MLVMIAALSKTAILCVLPFLLAPPLAAQAQLPPGEGKEVVERVCSPCHGVDPLTQRRRDQAAWQRTVDDMVSRGARASDEDLKVVVQYLARTFNVPDSEKTNPDRININKASAIRLTNALKLFPEEAEAIADYRDQHGNFKELEDLKKVPGLDWKKIEERKDHITF